MRKLDLLITVLVTIRHGWEDGQARILPRLVDGPNMYQYAVSNPLRFLDPDGRDVDENANMPGETIIRYRAEGKGGTCWSKVGRTQSGMACY